MASSRFTQAAPEVRTMAEAGGVHAVPANGR
jgi:hypothetical protein